MKIDGLLSVRGETFAAALTLSLLSVYINFKVLSYSVVERVQVLTD